MILSDLQAGLKETSGEIKLFVNQNLSPGKREYTLTSVASQGSRLTFCTGCTGAPNFFS